LTTSGSPRSGRRDVSRDEPLADPGSPERSFSRRTLIKAGWTVPVIIATVSLPTPAYAGSAPPPGPTPPGPTPPGPTPPGVPPAVPNNTVLPEVLPEALPTGVSSQAATLPSTTGSTGAGVLADTGFDARRVAEVGLGLLAAGAAATVVGRQRADTDERAEEDFED